jgi:hypothetical protein
LLDDSGVDMDEKRTFVRALISTRAKIKLLSPHELEEIRTLRAAALPLQGHPLQPADGEDDAPAYLGELVELLVQIDDKLDRVMDLLIHGKGGDAAPPEVLQTIDISGAGMFMVLSAPLEVGQLLQVTIRFPGFPLGLFKVLGEVVRIEPASEEQAVVYHTGVRFLGMTDAERDRLVAYTFMQQRRTIRESKKES